MMKTKEQYLEKLKFIQLVSFDVDGTMTDGQLHYLPNGEEFRSYHAHDGVGILLLQALGIKTVMMTTGDVEPLKRRGESLKMDYVETGIHHKDQRLKEIATQENIPLEHVVHMGDDINDVPAFMVAGLSIAVQNASKEALKFADFQLDKKGGDGAIRSFVEDVYEARNLEIRWDLLQDYFQKLKAMQ